MNELRLRDRILYVDRPAIMGILNVNTDSFSDPGPRTVDQAVEKALKMREEGAAIIDIGAQSSITLRKPVPVEHEVAKVGLVIDEVLRACPEAIISVDTFKLPVARAVLEKGAHLINDASGLRTPQIASLCAAHQAGLVIMHTSAPPLTRLQDPGLYRDISVEVVSYLERARAVALERGVRSDSIVLDPGPDFTKTPAQTIELLASIRDIIELANPILWHRQLGGAGCGWDDRLGCSGRGGAGVGGGWRAVVCGVPLPCGDHQPWCVAVSPLPAELPRGAGDDAPARDRGLPRNGAAVVCHVRADLRQRATTPAASPW
jgi:dihydropteroate synthase